MSKLLLSALILIIVGGVYFFGAGITGFVVSETCCHPPNCSLENQCPTESPNTLLNSGEILLGLLLLGIGVITYGLWYIGSRL